MYKITLFDDNTPPFVSFTFSCYCDDIDAFEEEWLKHEYDEDRIDRFRRSKAGEIVTDFYSDSLELNIVQKDDAATIYHERDILLIDKTLTIHNGYHCPQEYDLHKVFLHLRYVKVQGELLLLAKYRIEGICMRNPFREGLYTTAACYGNPVLKFDLDDERKDSADTKVFEGDTIESFVYLIVRRFDSINELEADYRRRAADGMTDEELDELFCDIPGEAG